MTSLPRIQHLIPILILAVGACQASTVGDSPSTTVNKQTKQGKALYQQYCVTCHGNDRNGGAFAPALTGNTFYGKWGGRSVNDLLNFVTQTMPPSMPARLKAEEYHQILSYILEGTKIVPEGEELPLEQLWALYLPEPPGGKIQQEVIDIPPAPVPTLNPLDAITPVSDELLLNPPAKDWLMWRRTYDGKGFSPLRQITENNVKDLQLVWSWSLPQGRNLTTPLVHDGVMFMYGFGDGLFAFDAKSGDLLWRYDSKGEGNAVRFGLRSISLYENSVIFPTDDGNVVALDVKTGNVVWNRSIVKSPLRFNGGPLVADGKILLGTSSRGSSYERNFIVALDAKTGEELWRRYTVANPTDPGGDTWNNLAAEERSGAGMYVPGSYDPETKQVFFGTGNNYFNEKLLKPAGESTSNDQLYTNSTLALDVQTGNLNWYFQHLPNDQWNSDWTFERTVMELPINGKKRRVVVTGGKQAIFEALQIKDGKYQFSIDMGLQNIVESIDAKTGAKKIAATAIPEKGKSVFICPSAYGVRNWPPTAFVEKTNILYVPFNEICRKIRDPMPGDNIIGGFGNRPYPRPDSDGNFGGIRAINLTTKATLWTNRQRAEPTTGILLTAGKVAFTGFADRMFIAYQSDTGKELWRTRLNDIPSASPITFMVDGKQYVAVITGEFRGSIAPEISNPQGTNAMIWVFALPENTSDREKH